MPRQTMIEKILQMRKRNIGRREEEMNTNYKHEHIRKQMELYKEKTRMLQQMMDSLEALARELQAMEKEMEAQRKEVEAEQHVVVARQPVFEERNQWKQQADQLLQRMDNLAEQAQKIHAAMEGMGAGLEGLRQELNDGLEEIRGELAIDPEEEGEDIFEKLDSLKEEITEKVHTESVKCYRNVQSLVEETKKELEEAYGKSTSGSESKGPLRAAIVLGAVNVGLILLLGLYEMGVFGFLF